MESTSDIKIQSVQDERQAVLTGWLQEDCGLSDVVLVPMKGDASFRRYFRAKTRTGTHVVMDAPPPRENCRPFVAISHALCARGLHAPAILAADINQGFLLLTDFGDETYLTGLTADNADGLYRRALSALAVLQGCRDVADWTIPLFGADWMWNEWEWFTEWFAGKLVGIEMGDQRAWLDTCLAKIITSALEQPQVFMHRDFHSANLMVLPDHQVGILDFQDAFIGPVTYDLVSLLRDCYIAWPEEQVMTWVHLYVDQLIALGVLTASDRAQFIRWFDWMGMERHLKALFTFSRKAIRDSQPHYLRHVPRALHYLITVSAKYDEMKPLHLFLRDQLEPASRQVVTTCVP